MKYYGSIGFSETVQDGLDRWVVQIKEYQYAGDINRVSTGWKTSEHLVDDISVSMEISFVGDLHARNNYNKIRYAVWNGVKWRVTNVTENHPRIILTLGGEYNDEGGATES